MAVVALAAAAKDVLEHLLAAGYEPLRPKAPKRFGRRQ
jgi:hypothetical protein